MLDSRQMAEPIPQRPEGLPKRWIVLSILLAIAIAAPAVWVLTQPPAAEGPITMQEFLDLHPSRSAPGTTYVIQDTVTRSELLTTPGLSWGASGNFSVTPSARMTFTAVAFETEWDFSYYFLGNRVSEFPVGSVVRFSVVSRTWFVWGRAMPGFEHYYVFEHLQSYDSAIVEGNYRPFEADTVVANGTFYVNITSTTDVYPLPANWRDIRVWFARTGVGGVPVPGNASLYVAGNLAGALVGRAGLGLTLGNSTLDLPFGPGQSLQIPFDGTYGLIRLTGPETLGTVLLP